MRVTIKDVAKAAGVSVATASRAVGGYGYVSEKTREKVLKAAKDLSYRPHAVAKSMVTGVTQVIGFVVGDIKNPFFASLAGEIDDVISSEGYNLIIYTTDENIEKEKRAVESLIERQVDGLIIAPASCREYSHINALTEMDIPLVIIDRMIKDLKADTIVAQNEEGAYEATSYLIKKGHDNIGFLSDSFDITSNAERLAGYIRALNEHNIAVDESLIKEGNYSVKDGYRNAAILINNRKRPSAIFASNNLMTEGLLLAAKDMKIDIPEELAVIGFDDLEWYQLICPQVSVVRQPIHEIGNIAAKYLLQRIDKNRIPYRITRLNTELIIRESC